MFEFLLWALDRTLWVTTGVNIYAAAIGHHDDVWTRVSSSMGCLLAFVACTAFKVALHRARRDA
jgi:hypothetical protein